MQFTSGNSQKLSGTISRAILDPQSALSKQEICSGVIASLYRVDTDGRRVEPPITTAPVDSTGSYSFEIRRLGLHISKDSPGEILIVSVADCSSKIYTRLVTGSKNQDVTMGSSLLSYLLNTDKRDNLVLLVLQNSSMVNELIQKFGDVESLESAFSLASANEELQARFVELFGGSLSLLNSAAPEVKSISVPAAVNELEKVTWQATVAHWSRDYEPHYEWKIDDVIVGQESSYEYSPGENSQGHHRVQLRIGKDSGSGSFAADAVIQSFQYDLQVANTVPPVAPQLELTSGQSPPSLAVNSRALTLSLDTGNALGNCASFSNMALTENVGAIPDGPDFTLSCSQQGSQLISYSLATPEDGSKVLRLWAKDADGNISIVPKFLFLILDTTGPTPYLIEKPQLTSANASPSFSFSANDSGVGGIQHECKLDAEAWDVCTSPKSYTALADGIHSFQLRSSDGLGNVGETVTYSWTVDTLPPSVTITSPSVDAQVIPASSLGSVAVAGACSENGRQVVVFGSQTASCSDGQWAASLNLSSVADGSISLTVSQTDVAGNVGSSATRILIKDSVAPSIAIATPTALRGNSSAGVASWSLSEANVPANANFSVDLHNGTAWISVGTKPAIAGVNLNQAYTLASFSVPNVDISQAKMRISLSDAAGNQTQVVSGNFSIDSTPPAISSFVLAGGAASASGNTVSLSLTAADAGSVNSGISSYCFSLNSNMTGQVCSEVLPPVYSLPFASGSYTVYATVVDGVGNTSDIRSDALAVYLGTPPGIIVTSPVAGDAIPSVAGQALTIRWKATQTSASPLSKVSVDYLISGQLESTQWPAVDSYPVGQNLSPAINGGCSLSGEETGCATLGMPGALVGQKFRVIVRLSDEAGNVAVSSSVVLNGPAGLTLFAGTDSSSLGGTALSTSLSGTAQGMARDPLTGDMFLLQNDDVLRIRASSGIISKWAAAPGKGASDVSLSFMGAGINSEASNSGAIIDFDSQGNLFWVSVAGVYKWTRGSATASLLVGIPGGAQIRIVNDRLYYSVTSNFNCGAGCTYPVFNVYRYSFADASSVLIAGQDYAQAFTYASEGAAALSVVIGGWTVVPTSDVTESIWFFNDSYPYRSTALYSVQSNGNVKLETNISVGYGVRISRYLPSRGSVAVYDLGGSSFTLVKTDSGHATTSISAYNGGLRSAIDDGNQGFFTLNSSRQVVSYYSAGNDRMDYAGILPYAGDGDKAVYAQIRSPKQVAADATGTIYFKDYDNFRIRKIDLNGIISTLPWGIDWNVGAGAVALNLSVGAPATMLVTPDYHLTYQTNSYGPVGAYKGTAILITGACQYYCTNNSTANYAASKASSSTPQSLSTTNDDASIYLTGGSFAYDQGNFYHFMRERNLSVFRSYIKKIDAGGNYTEIAGNSGGAWNNPPVAVSAGQTLAGNTAGHSTAFRVANGIIYNLQNQVLLTGVEGGTWIRQLASGLINGFVVDKRGAADPLQSMIYFTKVGSTKLYRKAYTSTAGISGDEIEVADFAGVLTAPVIAEIDPVNVKTLYLTDGNSIYKYTNPSLP